eukprot:m.25204 g.25204  ORF g.25204 m.25204 type:complete len:118 (-) comp14914_c0_seq1:3031-3384(-)
MIEKMGLKTHVIDNYDNNDCGRPSKKQPTHPRLLCATDTLEPATRALYFAPSVFGIFLNSSTNRFGIRSIVNLDFQALSENVSNSNFFNSTSVFLFSTQFQHFSNLCCVCIFNLCHF